MEQYNNGITSRQRSKTDAWYPPARPLATPSRTFVNRGQTSGVGRHRTGGFGRSKCRSGHSRWLSIVAAFDPHSGRSGCRRRLGFRPFWARHGMCYAPPGAKHDRPGKPMRRYEVSWYSWGSRRHPGLKKRQIEMRCAAHTPRIETHELRRKRRARRVLVAGRWRDRCRA